MVSSIKKIEEVKGHFVGPYSLNSYVAFKPTPYGFRRLQQATLSPLMSLFDVPPPDETGYRKMQLWKFMAVFGPLMYVGAQDLIERFEITIETTE
jgi:hypothetical protein